MSTKVGRPTKLTKELQDEIVKVVRAGNYIETASAYAGVEKKTLYNWMKRGRAEIDRLESDPKAKLRKKEAPYVEFLHALERAMAQAEVRDVSIIGRAAETDWKASAWRLSRKFPRKWGDKSTLQAEVEHTGEIHKKEELTIKDQIQLDPESKELALELWRRQRELRQQENE